MIVLMTLILGAFSDVLAQYSTTYIGETYATPDSTQETQDDIARLMQEARALYEQGISPSAIQAYQQVLERDPTNEMARLELGKIALETKNWAYAIRMLSELAELRPNDVETRRILMEIYYTYEEPLLEMKTAYELLQLSPNDVALLERIAKLFELHEMYLEEILVVERLADLNPQQPEYLWTLAKLYRRENNMDKEIQTYERLLELQPQNSMLYKRLARLYGASGDVQQQIICYEKALELEGNNQYVLEALNLAYAQALTSREPFDLATASHYSEQFDPDSADVAYFHELSNALKLARNPEVKVAVNNQNHDFSGNVNNLELLATVSFAGPVSGSRLIARQSFLVTDAPDEPPFLRDLQLFKLNTARLYRFQLSWQQSLEKLRFDIAPGLLGLMSTSPGALEYGPNLIGTVGLVYLPNEVITLSAGYDLNYLTITPQAIEQEIRRDQLGFDLRVTPWDDLELRTEFQYLSFSDNNQGKTFVSEFDYTILRTSAKVDDIEAYVPLAFDDIGMQITSGLRYEYITYDEERESYPTAINEHILGIYVGALTQAYRSFFINLEAFLGLDNKQQNIWGYHIGLEKQLTWRLNLAFEYENFRSPYVFDGEDFVNQESRIYFGVRSRF